MVRSLFQGPGFETVVDEKFVFGLPLGDELYGFFGSFVGITGLEVVSDVVFAIEVECCRCGDACGC